MALDGTVISCMAWELNHALAGGKINKIAQPEKDELMLTIKNNRKQYRLLVSASASLPLVYLTDQNKTGPMTAPNFCMLLRKHIGSGRILRIWQPGMERILNMEIEHLNELGDICRKLLIIELMGKHSNIIFCQEDGMILDSIKHVSAQVSSVREVLPGRMYFIPETQHKYDPQTITEEEFFSSVCQKLKGDLYNSDRYQSADCRRTLPPQQPGVRSECKFFSGDRADPPFPYPETDDGGS